MSQTQKAVYFFCNNEIDHVAGPVLKAALEISDFQDTAIVIDDAPVLQHTDETGNQFYYVRTCKVLSHDYTRYLPIVKHHFSDCDIAGIITWHGGQNAPDGILTVHTTGDVDTGNFGPAHPGYMRNLLLSMEQNRMEAGLQDFRATTEATHWSGIVYQGGSPDLIPQFPVPLLDIEIGSSPAYWSNQLAAKVIAKSLLRVFTSDGRKIRNLLCAGGVHFEPAFANAAFQTWENYAFGISHILANQWLVTGQYEKEDGKAKLENCVRSIHDGIEGIVFHDNLKGVYKDCFRELAAQYNIPVFKHQVLRRPEDIPWINR
jgi:D-tyrosyl-tRNA(Tyr) deacylase